MARRQGHDISEVIQRRRWSKADAQLVLKASQESGMSPSSFARECGLQPARIWRWSARLREQANRPMLFHPVRIVEPPIGGQCPGSIEVVLLDGRRVRVPEGFAAADLARVLAVLEGAVSC
jgi:transposase-like protein